VNKSGQCGNPVSAIARGSGITGRNMDPVASRIIAVLGLWPEAEQRARK
jgi:hypothetical protein